MKRRCTSVVLVLLFVGCADPETPPSRADSGVRDGGLLDAGDPTPDLGIDDAGELDASTPLDASLGSRCTVTPTSVSCPHETRMLSTGAARPMREVHFQVPLGTAPAAGFPVVLMFQGSGVSAERTWSGTTLDIFGIYYQALVVARLLDAGYAVVTPEAALDGSTYYDTNVPPYATLWESAPDHQLMLSVFAAIDGGDFGALDASSMFATGISSGGYMTSRMAVSYPGRFRALAIQSGSYATCGGSLCLLPATLPADHPPTLFLHGVLDTFVPIATMYPYEAQLRTNGVATRLVSDPLRAHEWLPVAPDEVLAWFNAAR